MIISAIRILYDHHAPDPTYKNLYIYDPSNAGSLSPNAVPYAFFDELRIDQNTPIPKYDVPFPEGGTICPIGETETGFTIEIPTDGDFPARPLYLILTTETGYRYAFIDSYTRTASTKIRCVARFDQWTEHFAELYGSSEWSFSRSHQRRYVDPSATPRVKVYNGLSDPAAEGMVQGTKQTIPLEVYGAKKITRDGDARVLIPVWMYWRLASNTLWVLKSGGDPDDPSDYDPELNPGMDPLKGSVPVMALCVGSIEYSLTGAIKPIFRPNTATEIVKEDGTGAISLSPTSGQIMAMLTKGHPYLAQAYITTIPPVNSYMEGRTVGGVFTPTLVVKDDTTYNYGKYVGDGQTYIVGSTAAAGIKLSCPGTLIALWQYSPGDRTTTALTEAAEYGDYNPRYEVKIEESAFEGKTLQMFGAEIDVSPTRAIPDAVLSITLGAHNDVTITTSDGVEIYRAAGVCSQFGVDISNDSLTTWLVSNYNTYQNAKMWKVANAAVSGVAGIAAGVATYNYAGAAMAAVKTGMALGETFTSEAAMKKDLQASPNATTIPSQNAIDNFPLLDLPTISKRTIPDDVKARIMDFWHIYGYPDNRVGTIADGLNRMDFHYLQASLVRAPAGLYPGEYAAIESALRSGVWLWMTRHWSAVPPIPSPPGFVRHWLTTPRFAPLLSLDNSEF